MCSSDLEKLTAFQHALLDDVRDTFQSLKTQDDRGGLKIEDLPAALRNRFVGRTGKYLLQVYPKKDVWQRGPQEEFVRDLRRVVPDVTGTPVQHYEYSSMLRNTLEHAALYATVIVALMIFLHFRRISSVLLAFLPVALGRSEEHTF